jgi:protein SCO1/2
MQPHLMTRSRRLAVATAVLALLAGGCTRSASPGDAAMAHPEADAAERRFPLTGLVVRADPSRQNLRIQHDAIAGLMPAMTMDFPVAEGDWAIAREGHRIRAELVQRGTEFSLEHVWPDDPTAAATIAAGAAALQQDTVIRGKAAYREVGETVPDFALFDQTGQVVQINRFRGRPVVLNFIFTRCPIATMCPAATARMVALQQAARTAGVAKLELVSISLDPTYDTPGVLRDYAVAHGIDTANFSLLTGPEPAIRNLLAQLGVIAEFKDGVLRHTLATLLIDPAGRIVWREDGSAWDPAVFIGRMQPPQG